MVVTIIGMVFFNIKVLTIVLTVHGRVLQLRGQLLNQGEVGEAGELLWRHPREEGGIGRCNQCASRGTVDSFSWVSDVPVLLVSGAPATSSSLGEGSHHHPNRDGLPQHGGEL